MKFAQSRCRLCFDKHNEMFDIFDEYGCRKSVREKIISRLHIFIAEDDILPTKVCIVCYGKLESYDAFIKDVQKTQIKLLEYVQDQIKYLSSKDTLNEECSMNNSSVICISDDSDFDDDVIEIGEEHEKYDTDFEIVECMSLPNTLKQNSTDRPVQYFIEKKNDGNKSQNNDVHNLKLKIVKACNEISKSIPESKSIESKSSKIDNFSNVEDEFPYYYKYPERRRKNTDFCCQVGNSIAAELSLKEEELLHKNPLLKVENMLVTASVLNLKEDPTLSSISSSYANNKSCQTTIILALRSRTERSCWTGEQKIFLRQYFHNHYISRTLPSRKECIQLIKGNTKLFENKTDGQIRQYFINRKYYKRKK